MNARISLTLIFGLILFTSSLQAQDTLIVSPRVGKVLDAEERSYFGLFPSTTDRGGFAIVENEYSEVLIVSSGLILGRMTREQLKALHQYMAEYDSLRAAARTRYIGPFVNRRYEGLRVQGIVADFDVWEGEIVRVAHRPIDMTVVAVTGELLWADGEQLYILPESDGDESAPVRVSVSSVTAISIYTDQTLTGAIIGGVIGAAIAAGATLEALNNTARTKDDSSEHLSYILPAAALGGLIVGGLGALIGSASPSEERIEINTKSDYLNLIPSLTESMYYRHGLPPDSPWREK